MGRRAGSPAPMRDRDLEVPSHRRSVDGGDGSPRLTGADRGATSRTGLVRHERRRARRHISRSRVHSQAL